MKRSSFRAVAVAVLTLSASLLANAGAVNLKPGTYRTESQLWINGKEVLNPMLAQRNEMLQRARARMSPAMQAEFDRQMAEENQEKTSCVTPADLALTPEQRLQQIMASMNDDAPLACTFANKHASDNLVTFEFNCKTPAGAQSKGKARFEIGHDSYRTEITSHGQAFDSRTGAPVSAATFDSRLLTHGQWLSAECDAADDENDTFADGEPADDGFGDDGFSDDESSDDEHGDDNFSETESDAQ